jgi:hypothetical protein
VALDLQVSSDSVLSLDKSSVLALTFRLRRFIQVSRLKVIVEPDLAHTVELMTEFMEDHALRRQAREAGPAHVRAHLTWDHAAQQLLDLLSGPPETARIDAAA